MNMDISQIDQIVDKYKSAKNALIQILLDIETENRWLPEDVLKRITERLNVPLAQINHIATFYKAFHLTPRGRHIISVCTGTACHVRGSPRILDRVTELIGIKPGQTSEDQRFSLDTVNCLGCCAMGPVMVVDGKYNGKVSASKVGEILVTYD